MAFPTEMGRLLTDYVHADLNADETKRAEGLGLAGGEPDIPDDYYEEVLGTLEEALHDTRLQRAIGYPHARSILTWAGKPQPPSAQISPRLLREAIKARIVIESTKRERNLGRYNNDYDSGRRYGVARPASPKPPTTGNSAGPSGSCAPDGLLLSELIQKFVREKMAKTCWTQKTLAENEAIYEILLAIVGDISVRDLNRDTMVGFLEKVQKLPANIHKDPRFSEMGVAEILAVPDLISISQSTAGKYLRRAASLLEHAVTLGILHRNPAKGLTIDRDHRQEHEERHIYSRQNISKLVGEIPAWIHRSHTMKAERFWIPLIGMYSGMRLDEICQLHADDVRQVDGIWCLDVNSRGEKKIKTASSRRCVPIHPFLLEIGFLKYWQTVCDAGLPRVWMSLKRNKNGFGGTFSKRFGDFHRAKVTMDRRVVFHSFRHTVADELKQKGVRDAIVCALLGHKHNGSESSCRYGKAYQPTTVLEAVRTLDYGLDVDVLRQIADSVLGEIPR